MKNKVKKINWDLLPVLLMVILVPLAALGRKVPITLEKYSWFPDGEFQYDFFMYTKSIIFLFLVIWMLIVLFDRVLIRRKSIKYWKYFVPLYVYGCLVIISTILTHDRSLSIKGMWQQYESVWVLLGYIVAAFYCVQILENTDDIKVILYGITASAVMQGILGISQFAGKDFFASAIGRSFLTLGMDEASRNAVNYLYAGNTGSSVYMASYTPNYAGIYVVMMLPLLLGLAITVQKKLYTVLLGILWIILLICLYGSGSRTGAFVLVLNIFIMVFALYHYKNQNNHRKQILFGTGAVLIACILFGYMLVRTQSFPTMLQKTTYNMESIKPTDHGIQLIYKGNLLNIIPEDTDGGVILTATEENGTKKTAVWNSQIQGFVFEDTAYENLIFDAYEQRNVHYLVLHDGEIDWNFFKEPDSQQYVYLNQYGKADQIINAKSVFKGYESVFSGRGYIWGRTIPLLKKYFLWGSGPDTFAVVFPQTDYVMKANTGLGMYQQLPTKAHSIYLQNALQTGSISLICLMMFWIRYFIQAIKSSFKEKNREVYMLRLGIMLATGGFLLMGFMNDSNLAVSPIFWCLLGAGIAIELKLKNNAEIK